MKNNFAEIAKILKSNQNFLLTTHPIADGDGIGAEISLYECLKNLGKNVFIVNPDAIPERYAFLDNQKIIKDYSNLENTNSIPENIDVFVVVDTTDIRRLSHLFNDFSRRAKKVIFIDHHPQMKSENRDHTEYLYLVDERSSSIGEILYRLFHHMVVHINEKIANALYVSIMTDTNSFRYERTTCLSHRIAADLIGKGVHPEEIYQNVYSSKHPSHLKLLGEVLCSLKTTEDERVAWVEIDKDLRQKYSATADDTQSFVNFLLLLKNADLLVVFREEDNGKIKAHLRSKGNVPVNGLAERLGGGGHLFASGVLLDGPLSEAVPKVIDGMKNLITQYSV